MEVIRLNHFLLFGLLCVGGLLAACQTAPTKALSPQQQLLAAAGRGESERVLQLLASGVDSNTQTADGGVNALLLASENGHLRVVQGLLAYGADPNVASTKGGFSPLIRASIAGHTPLVRILLHAGANADYQSTVGGTALMWATLRRQHDVMQVLLRAGASVNARGNRGESALSFAVTNDDTRAAAMLLAQGGDPHLPDMLGKTPADQAHESGRQEILNLIERQHQRLQERSI